MVRGVCREVLRDRDERDCLACIRSWPGHLSSRTREDAALQVAPGRDAVVRVRGGEGAARVIYRAANLPGRPTYKGRRL